MKRQGDRPPVVAHVVHRFDFGGLENGVANLLNHLPESRFSQFVISMTEVGEEFSRRVEQHRSRIIAIGKRPGKDFASYRRLFEVIRGIHADVVHTRNLGTLDVQWIAAMAGVRARIHGEHGWDASDPMGQNAGALRRRRLCRPVVGRYVAMSRDIEQWLYRDVHVKPGVVTQIYNGVDTERFDSRHPGGQRRTGDDRIVIGSVGRLDPIKNHGLLLKAVELAIRTNAVSRDQVRLVIVGSGPREGELKRMIENLDLGDIAVISGSTGDVASAMRDMDVFVLPSINEGISNTVLEAMATGIPVLAFRVGGNPELIEHDVSGVLLDRSESDDDANCANLAYAIARYIRDPELRARQGEAARTRAVMKFGLRRMVDEYARLYDEVLQSRRH